ncbi:MAG: sugar ABC transporter permease [Ruminococcaceae bacterium]|nr:sugar ABC transporter permease [Oscillospiraceae bacterium]
MKIETKSTSLESQSNKALIIKKYLPLYVMMIPSILYYVLFVYKPMGGLAIAFQDYSLFKGIIGSEWVGFIHFKEFLTTPYFFRTMKNTIVLNVWLLVFSFPAPIIFALLLNEVRNLRVKKVVQTLSYMPHFISTVVIAGIVINLLSPSYGIITKFVEMICGERIYFLVNPHYFRTIYTVMNIWQTVGYGAIVYIAAISGIDSELYEAAVIDGANKFKQIWHITLPSILPTVVTMLILRVGGMMRDSTDTILLLYNPSTYEVSDVLGTYVYRRGLLDADYSYSTAVSIFNSFIGLLLVVGTNYVSKKVTEYSLW